MQQVKITYEAALRLCEILAENGHTHHALTEAMAAASQYSGNLTALRKLAEAGGRPICGFDIESTSAEPTTGRIIELGIVKIMPANVHTEHVDGIAKSWLFNPGVLIPADATEVHGFDDASVAGKPSFEETAAEVLEFIEGCDFATFNGNKFDVIMLNAHFDGAGVDWPAAGTRFFDASTIYKKHAGRTLGDAVSHYLGETLQGAHGALADTLATIQVFAAQLEADPELAEMTPDELRDFCSYNPRAVDLAGKIALNDAGVPVWTFGKNKDLPVDADRSYIDWVLRSDFTRNTKNHVKRILRG